ncbi:hypothetical protein ABIE49_008117 [Bradyrhizobium sp. OAE829]
MISCLREPFACPGTLFGSRDARMEGLPAVSNGSALTPFVCTVF